MVTGPIPPINQALNPTAPPPVAPTPPAPSAPSTPTQTGFTPQAPGGQSSDYSQTNGTDTAQFSQNAIQAQTAPPPPAGNDQSFNSLNPGAPSGTPPFPGVVPSAAQTNDTGFVQSQSQSFLQSAPTSPFQDLTAGQTIDLTA
ncbi:hypothetical protein K8I31_22800 [bacterium]|nr:hypothetical protein [bacterium]